MWRNEQIDIHVHGLIEPSHHMRRMQYVYRYRYFAGHHYPGFATTLKRHFASAPFQDFLLYDFPSKQKAALLRLFSSIPSDGLCSRRFAILDSNQLIIYRTAYQMIKG